MSKSLDKYKSLEELKEHLRKSYRHSGVKQSDFLKSEHLNSKSLFSKLQDELNIITDYLKIPENELIQDVLNQLKRAGYNDKNIENQYNLKVFNKNNNKLLLVSKNPTLNYDKTNIEFAKGIINYINLYIGYIFKNYKDLLKYKQDKSLLKKTKITDLYDLKNRMNNLSFPDMEQLSNFDIFITRFILYVLMDHYTIIDTFIWRIKGLHTLLYYKRYEQIPYHVKTFNIKQVIKSIDFLNELNMYVNPNIIVYLNRTIGEYNEYIKHNIKDKSLNKLPFFQNKVISKTNSYNRSVNSRKSMKSRITKKVKTI